MFSAWMIVVAVLVVEIGAEHNTTIVFPLPIDLITSMTQVLNGSKRVEAAVA